MWQIFLFLSAAVIAFSFVYVLTGKNKANRSVSSVNLLLCAVFVANILAFVPAYYGCFADATGISQVWKTFIASVHHSIRLFVVDCDFSDVGKLASGVDGFWYNLYTCYMAVLFFLSPILTFGFIFSFFRNVSARRKYIKNYNKDAYIFSEFNEESVALAEGIKKSTENSVIIFTNISENASGYYDLFEKAKNLNSIFFKDDILTLNFEHHSKKKMINFMLISRKENDNIRYALDLINKYNARKNTGMYVLSNEIEGELMLNAATSGEIKVRRISNIRTMIYGILQSKGALLFEEAKDVGVPNQRLISAVVVGLGRYGKEMTKSLAWFCQMEGYRVEIEVFDRDPEAKGFFESMCPELMDERFNNKFDDPGESQYKINIQPAVDVGTAAFDKQIKMLTNTTYVFVALGSDEKNIQTSIKLRMLFEQMGIGPRIQTVVENPERKAALAGIKNYSGQPYNIEFVGAVDEVYSVGNIINSELEQEALKRHLCWGKEEDFWKYEYNYRSSMASALHKRMKKACNIPGIEKKPSDRTPEETQALRLMEHRRWNTYMRSEGYIYAEKRNNLAKTHHCLVTFDDLSQKDKEKDDD